MFEPVRENVLRWGTPDPEGDWMMYAHLIVEDGRVAMVDPPLVPGLLESAGRLGKVDAVILTTLDHTRGVNHIVRKTGATLYVPDQGKSKAVDPEYSRKVKGISDFETYGREKIHGLLPVRVTIEGENPDDIPWIDEFALLTDKRELITGDIAIGTRQGRIAMAPEWFPHDPPHEAYLPAHSVFRKILAETGATSLLASHGCNIYGTLQGEAEKLL